MPGPILFDPTPDWLKPQNRSVFDSPVERLLQTLGHWVGADDPTQQVVAPMAPMETGPNGGIAGMLQKVITAYHGSPHDFEKFDLSKIGTGEGAQAYGHGLYFAENEKTARAYRDNLSQFGHASGMPDDMTKSVILDGKVISGNEPSNRLTALQRAALAKHYAGGIQSRAIQEVEDSLKYMTPGTEAYRLDQETLDVLRTTDLTGRVQPFNGRMYEVAIKADPEQFLDWDKPLSQQSEAVRKAIAPKLQKIADVANPEVRAAILNGTAKGSDIHHWIAGEEHIASDFKTPPPQAASSALRQAGVPGLKYYDSGSRTAAGGFSSADRAGKDLTRNYVVFDDALIEIKRKYGWLPPAIATMLAKDLMQQRNGEAK